MKTTLNPFKIILQPLRGRKATIRLVALLLWGFARTTQAQGTAFTYEGQLNANGSPASGTYNLSFSLFNTNASGVAIAGPVTNNGVIVRNGLFTALIDFGPGVLTGASNWLEIGVETNGVSSFTTLTPRQQLTPTPYAIYAESAGELSGALPASQLTSIGNTNGGSGNFFVGQSGNATTSGYFNTANGNGALFSNTSGNYNTANGFGAIGSNTNGSGNTANGFQALSLNTSGSYNTANGLSALSYNTSGSYNTASGFGALFSNTSGSDNTASGVDALYLNMSGSLNTANGFWALENNTSGSVNSANGAYALWFNISGSYNTANGAQALALNTNGSYNTADGFSALFSNTSGTNNTANGCQALYSNTNGWGNTANGYQALFDNASGYVNTANGYQALFDNTSGFWNTANGTDALYSNGTGNYNTANGGASLFFNTTGGDNTADGYRALFYNMTGSYNTANGEYALGNVASGSSNIGLGYNAGIMLGPSSSYNIDIGNQGLYTDANVIRIGSGQTSAYIAGVINGDGGGLTNVSAATLAIPPGMALVPAGAFTMGDNLDGESDAIPTLTVTVSAFYIDVNLVSLSQWQSVYFWATSRGYSFVYPGSGKAANHPVQTVDWYDAVKWSNARSQQAGKTPVYYTDAGFTQLYTNGEVTPYANWAANGYRLPTEAEWEKAARGGLSGQRFPWGNVITENLANYDGDTGTYGYDLGPNGYNPAFTNGALPYTSPGGYFAPNGYGLYDLAGNVFEWCSDWFGTPYAGGSDPRGPASGSYRVLRGASWNGNAYNARCADRYDSDPAARYEGFGFRCVRGL